MHGEGCSESRSDLSQILFYIDAIKGKNRCFSQMNISKIMEMLNVQKFFFFSFFGQFSFPLKPERLSSSGPLKLDAEL